MQLRGGPVLGENGRAVGIREPVELGPTADLAVYAVDTTIARRPATAAELARLEPVTAASVRPGPAMHRMRPATNPGSWRNYRSALGTPVTPPDPVTTVTTVSQPEEAPVTVTTIPPALPCDTCLHEPVCYLKRELSQPETLLREPHILGPGLRLVFDAARVECDHQLASVTLELPAPEPQPIRREHGGESWRSDKAPKEDAARLAPVTSIDELSAKVAAAPSVRPGLTQESRMRGAETSKAIYAAERARKDATAIEQLRVFEGNAEAVGRAMGVTGAAVKQWIARMTEDGTLPADVADLVASRSVKARKAVPA